ncbi:MAG: alpha/beta fold hydrolase [Pseudonocardiaceae bacterium]
MTRKRVFDEEGIGIGIRTGDRDHPDFARVARLLAAKIPGARLEILPDADHLPPMRTRRPVHQPARGLPRPVRHCMLPGSKTRCAGRKAQRVTERTAR